MINPDDVVDIEDDEMLARFILAGQSTKSLRKLVRKDNTVRPELYMPYKHVELSVNRHRDCDEGEIWDFGQAIAEFRKKKFWGRSDIAVESCMLDKLSVVAKPIRDDSKGIPDNPNHADIVGFPPTTKEDQKSLAEKLAAKATDRKAPPDSE